MDVPMGFREVREARGARGFGVLRGDVVELGCDPFWREGEELPGARGRGGARLLEPTPGLRVVARRYRRGGLFGGLLGDRYLSPGRAVAELAVLADLRAAGVPAVVPVAALARRAGAWRLWWRLRLATELVVGALPLPGFLAQRPELRRAAVERAGQVVGRAFAAGLRHPDLHPDNLLARVAEAGGGSGDRAVEVWLVDLDRARLAGRPVERARDRMLLRMARYLHRHASRLRAPPTAAEHLRFLRGMGWNRAARRQHVPRLHAALLRAVARHRLLWRR